MFVASQPQAMTFPLALLLPTVVADCDGILAGSECCAPEETMAMNESMTGCKN